MIDPEMLINSNVNQAIVATPAIGMDDVLLGLTLPRIMPCSVALEALGTISV